MRAPVDYSNVPDPWWEFDQVIRRDLQRQRRRKWLLLILLATALVVSLICIGTALAHEAEPSKTQPLGWTYDYSCCSAFDCRSVGTTAVSETPQGYVVKLTGEVIPYGDKRIKRSKDEFYHQCTIGGDPKATHSICLYVPDRGF